VVAMGKIPSIGHVRWQSTLTDYAQQALSAERKKPRPLKSTLGL